VPERDATRLECASSVHFRGYLLSPGRVSVILGHAGVFGALSVLVVSDKLLWHKYFLSINHADLSGRIGAQNYRKGRPLRAKPGTLDGVGRVSSRRRDHKRVNKRSTTVHKWKYR